MESYESWVSDVKECRGGCLRGETPNPMLRPKGRYKIPSDIMMLLQDPNKADERYNKCLTLFYEDYARWISPDETAKALWKFFDITGINGRSIYVVNSLLCWQFVRNEKKTSKDCWLPCLDGRKGDVGTKAF